MESNADTIAKLRKEYSSKELTELSVSTSPFEQFRIWFNEAVNAGIEEPNAMVLSTVKNDGSPSGRVVLLKDHNESGFTFFTNYESHKGQELQSNPNAAMTCFWGELERQVRICGKVEQVSGEESDKYFATRPREAQIGAWISKQSSVVKSRSDLENRFLELSKSLDGKPISRPNYWGGYRLIPHSIEFWQGRLHRLHDRIHYSLGKGKWVIVRLAP